MVSYSRGRGTGPGFIAPDGSAVEFYSAAPAEDEPDIVRSAIGDGGSVLELGSGPGRVTHALVDRGYEVVAVDESAQMLERVRGAKTVCAKIEDLDLGQSFDCVLMASQLLNTPSRAQLNAFLTTCRRHVRLDGCVLVEWLPPDAFDAWTVGDGSDRDGIAVTLAALHRPAPDIFAVTMRYEVESRTWTQTFTCRRLTDDDLQNELARAGLVLETFRSDDRRWFRALPGLSRPCRDARMSLVVTPARSATIARTSWALSLDTMYGIQDP